jgi:hypothetical protein
MEILIEIEAEICLPVEPVIRVPGVGERVVAAEVVAGFRILQATN